MLLQADTKINNRRRHEADVYHCVLGEEQLRLRGELLARSDHGQRRHHAPPQRYACHRLDTRAILNQVIGSAWRQGPSDRTMADWRRIFVVSKSRKTARQEMPRS